MTGHIQWSASQEFKQGDVVLNGGLFWQLKSNGWRIFTDLRRVRTAHTTERPQGPSAYV